MSLRTSGVEIAAIADMRPARSEAAERCAADGIEMLFGYADDRRARRASS